MSLPPDGIAVSVIRPLREAGAPLLDVHRAYLRGACVGLWSGQKTTPRRARRIVVEAVEPHELHELQRELEAHAGPGGGRLTFEDCTIRITDHPFGTSILLTPRDVTTPWEEPKDEVAPDTRTAEQRRIDERERRDHGRSHGARAEARAQPGPRWRKGHR